MTIAPSRWAPKRGARAPTCWRPAKWHAIRNDNPMTDLWIDDADLFAQARRELFTAVVGDIMDKLGFQHQFLPPAIQPLERNMVTIGRAMTVLEADFFEEAHGASHNPLSGRPFGLMLDAEVVRVIDGRIFEWGAHAARLARGLSGIRIPLDASSIEALKSVCERLVRGNALAAGGAAG